MDRQQQVSFPVWKNAIPGLPFIGSIILNVAVEGLSLQGWWVKVPFLHIAAIAAVFWAGMTFSDLWNPNSQLRRWWTEKTRSFVLYGIGRNRIDADNNEKLELFCTIRFLRDLSNPLLTIRLTQLIGNDKTRVTIVHQERLGEIVKDKTMKIRFGTVSKPMPGAKATHHSIWGTELPTADLKDGQLAMVGGDQDIVEIAIDGKAYKILAQPIMNQDLRVILQGEDDRLIRTLF